MVNQSFMIQINPRKKLKRLLTELLILDKLSRLK